MKSLNGAAVAAAWGALAAGTLAHAQEAVQWRVEDGGNGHWYGVLPPSNRNWNDWREYLNGVGSGLCCLESLAEVVFVETTFQAEIGVNQQVFVGGFQSLKASEPDGGWEWVSGSVWKPLRPWTPANSNYCSGEGEDALTLIGTSTELLTWNDAPHCWTAFGAIFEFSADCNDDGIVDYGQILDGTLEDADGNGVPDCCDDGSACQCVGDVNFDGIVNGADISVLLGFWGLNGKPNNADTNNDGQVDGTDLANVLGSWGECP